MGRLYAFSCLTILLCQKKKQMFYTVVLTFSTLNLCVEF